MLLSSLALGVCLAAAAADANAASDAVPVPPAPVPAAASVSEAAAGPRRLLQEDVQPTVGLARTEEMEVYVGGLLQLHGAALAGEDSLVANGDLASHPGFRLRRARFGLETRYRGWLGLLLAVNPLESDTETGTVSDAKISADVARWLRLTAGTGKVPFSAGALISSRTMLGIERPLSVGQIAPSRRLGLSAEGELWKGRVGYLVGVMNGTEGFSQGNAFGGILYGGRVELTPFGVPLLGRPADEGGGVSLGASALFDDGPSVNGTAYSFDLTGAWFGASLRLEALFDDRSPEVAPAAGNALLGRVERRGAYAEAGYARRIAGTLVQAVARVERFDDNVRLEDAGDVLLALGGVNVEIVPGRARAQLQYVARRELHGIERDNDGLVLSLQGAF